MTHLPKKMYRYPVARRLLVSVATCVLLIVPARAQTYFADCVSVTGSSANIIIPASSNPKINSEPIALGDEIAVFTQDGMCAGATVWTGSNVSLTAWGDDSVTPAADGFAPDESFTFRVWDKSENAEGTDVTVTYSSAQPFYRTAGTYRENAIYAVSSLEAVLDDAQTVPDAPTLLFPEDSAIEVPTTVNLEWEEVGDATSYLVQVATDAVFSQVLINENGLSSTVYELSDLEKATTYYWRVRGVNEAGNGEFSSVFSFDTEEPPVIENDRPVFESVPVSTVLAGSLYSYDVLATDPDGDILTLEIVQSPGWLTLQSTGGAGVLSGTPGSGQVGAHTITIRATDEHGASRNQTFSITVKQQGAINAPPEVVSTVPNQNVLIGAAPVIVDLSAIFADADGDPLAYDASASPPELVDAHVEGSTIRISPRKRGGLTIVIEARDVEGAIASTSFDVLVSGNRSPVARPDAATTKEDTPTLIDVRKNDTDPDGDELQIEIIVKPTNGTATVEDEGILYTPAEDYYGQDSFVYGISDGYGGKAAASVYLEVEPVDDAPKFPYGDAIVSPENGKMLLVSGKASDHLVVSWHPAVDPEGSAVSYRWELSLDDSFEQTLVEHNLGGSVEFSLSHADIVDLLGGGGLAEDESITLYHRVAATDGKLWSATDSRTVVLSVGSPVATDKEMPAQFSLHQNYPNPFNPRTTISYSLDQAGHIHLALYDVLGKQVRVLYSGVQTSGVHTVDVDGSELPSGLYVYRLISGNKVSARTATLLK